MGDPYYPLYQLPEIRQCYLIDLHLYYVYSNPEVQCNGEIRLDLLVAVELGSLLHISSLQITICNGAVFVADN